MTTTTTRTRPPRSNLFAGSCTRCHQNVPANEGILTGRPGAWTVTHNGDCPAVPATPTYRTNRYGDTCAKCYDFVPAGEGMLVRNGHKNEVRHLPTNEDCTELPEFETGMYLFTGHITGREKIIRIRTNNWSKVPYPAELKVTEKFDGTKDVTFEPISPSILRKIDPINDRLTYRKARELGHILGVCVRCARALSDDRSVYSGYGETCAKHQGWPYPSVKQWNVIEQAITSDDPDLLTGLAFDATSDKRILDAILDNPNAPARVRALVASLGTVS